MDALELLREDHRHVLDMLAKLEEAPGVTDGTDGAYQAARKNLVTEIVIAESQHEAIEEQFFWPAVRRELTNGDELANQAVDQERGAKWLLDRLDETPANAHDIDDMIVRLIHDGREHIEFEQNEVWPRVRESVSQDRLDELGDRMAAAKKTAPTRPHPDTPPGPAVQKTMGRMAALADRVRDRLTGRHK